MPGVGATPAVAQAAFDSHLTQYADVMGRGAAWFNLLSLLVQRGGAEDTLAWCSSTAEGYRQVDTTEPGDFVLDPMNAALQDWSSMRLMTYYARRLGMGCGGENPGYGDSNGYGVAMLNASMAQIVAGSWSAFAWAHDADLYEAAHGVLLADYVGAIGRVNGGAAV